MRVWSRALVAGLIVGVALVITGVLVRSYDLNVAAAAAAVVTALVALVAGVRGWLARAEPDQARRRRAYRGFAATAIVVAVAVGGGWWLVRDRPGAAPCPVSNGTLRVLAGHSLYADRLLTDVLERARAATGVTVSLGDQEGTLAAAAKVLQGDLGREYDAVWLPSNEYLLLDPRAAQVVDGRGVSIATSPVVLGLRSEVAARLGWHTRRPSWKDIAAAANAHEFTYGMTNPAISNSALSTLVAVNAAVGGDADQLRRFFSGQVITSASTGNLTDQYRRRAESGNPVQGLVSYESEILDLNPGLPASDRLEVVYPQDGTVFADFPLTLLKPATSDLRRRFEAVTCYLTGPEAQRALATTNRRPVAAGVALPAGADPAPPAELPFPPDLAATNALLFNFRDNLRKPSRTIYVLDVSGSMCWAPTVQPGDPCAAPGNRRIDTLVAALKGLAGADPEVPFADQVAEFSRREQIVLLPFSGQVQPPRTVNISQDLAAGQRQVRAEADRLRPGGATFLYEALERAYDLAATLIAQDPDRITSVVLLTDGEANGDRKFPDFRAYVQKLKGTPAGNVRTFTIALGESNVAELQEVADVTGGLAYNARVDSLTTIFFQIRGYL